MEMKKRINQVLVLIGFGFLSVSFTSAQNTVVNDDAMASINQNGNWLSYGRTHSEQRFSPLAHITKENVGALQPDWYFPIPNSRSLVSTPLVVDPPAATRGIFSYPVGASIKTLGTSVNV